VHRAPAESAEEPSSSDGEECQPQVVVAPVLLQVVPKAVYCKPVCPFFPFLLYSFDSPRAILWSLRFCFPSKYSTVSFSFFFLERKRHSSALHSREKQ
jgi:hypothetical protein